MKSKKTKSVSKNGKLVLKYLPYLVAFAVIVAAMAVGSQKDSRTLASNPIISAINDSSFVVTADQLSESYIVAGVANTFNLPTVASVNENYTSIAMKYAMTGAQESGVIEKPNIIDTSNLSRGIKTYVTVEGDTLESIASRYGVTTTQIRWSNNMKNDTISVGQRLYIPQVPGILYTVKEGDSVDALAEKYKSNMAQIITYNDLENTGLMAGTTIVLPGGELPEKERPEYVAPVARPVYTSTVRDSGTRHNIIEIESYSYWYAAYRNQTDNNPGSGGQCTWYAWHWRRHFMPENYWLPTGVIGNAGTWTYMAWSNNFIINKTPASGAVVQTSTGSPGHVGVVTGVVPGEYITVREMNYNYGRYRVIESQIYWVDALRYNYIHGKK